MRPAAAAVIAILALGAAQAYAQAPAPKIVIDEPGPAGRRIDADGVFANFFPAAATGRQPAVLYIGGSEGGLRGGAKAAGDFTAAGISLLQVCYFGCPGTPASLVDVPLESFERALAWLKVQPGVDPRRIAIVGGSKGAEAALLLAVRHPELKAVAAGMPSSVVWPAIGGGPSTSSWTEGGARLPALPYAFAAFPKRGVFGLYDEALVAEPAHPDAVIPVERIAPPLMLVCGEADTLWPSCRMAEEIARRRADQRKPVPILLRYADAGHAVFGPPVDPVPALASLGGTVDGNAAARRDSWSKAVAFLRERLRR